MKKLVALTLALIAAGFAFAEKYTVKQVKGTVNYVVDGELKKITPGLVLDETAIINSSASGLLIVTNEAGKDFRIAGVKKDALKKLAGPKVPAGNGITLGTAKQSDVAADKASGKGAATASSRADDVTQNDDWNE